MRTNVKVFVVWTLGLAVLFGMAGLAVPPASVAVPNTGGKQKTEKECLAEQAACKKNCDATLIDIDNNIERCKDLCTDGYIICTPASSSRQPGNKFGGGEPTGPSRRG